MLIEIKPLPSYAKYWRITTANIPHSLQLAAEYAAKKAIAFKTHMHEQEIHLNVRCIDVRYMKYLNKKHRGKNKITNVLSFSSDVMPDDMKCTRILGDIFVCTKVIEDEALEADKNFEEHFIHMVAHGALHLIGYDHETEEQSKIMQDVEIKLLKTFNIQNPYKIND